MADLSFNIKANTSDARAGLSAVTDVLEQVAAGLLDLVDAGRKAGLSTDQIAKKIQTVSGAPFKDAKKFIEDYDRALKNAGVSGTSSSNEVEAGLEQVSRQARRAEQDVEKIGSAGRSGVTEFSGAAKEVSSEIGQNFGQAVSSIRGNLSDLGQVGQDTLGGLAASVASMGPAGLAGAAGLGVAATAIGLLVAKFQEAEERRKELESNASDLGRSYIEAANGGASALDHMIDRLKAMAVAADDGDTNLEDLRQASDKSGNSFEDLAKAYAGNVSGLDALLSSGKDRIQQLQDEADAIDTTSQADEGRYGNLLRQIDAQTQYVQYVKDAQNVAQQAARDQDNFNRSGAQALLDQRARIEALKQTQADRLASDKQHIDDVAKAWQDASTDASDYIGTTDEGLPDFDVEGYLAKAEAVQKATEDVKANIVNLPPDIRAEAERVFSDSGAEAAGAYIYAYMSASADNQSRFAAAAAANGDAAAAAGADAVTQGLSTRLSKAAAPEIIVKARLDDSAAQNALDNLVYRNSQRVVTIKANIQDKSYQ